MCKYSCEECKLFLVHDGKFKVPKFQKIGTILSNMTAVMDEVNVSVEDFFYLLNVHHFKWNSSEDHLFPCTHQYSVVCSLPLRRD